MKYVAVRHKPEQTKLYWFRVPEQLSDMVSVGSRVVCNTRNGDNDGVVECVTDGVSMAALRVLTGCDSVQREIICVEHDFDVEDIHIPWDIADTNPSPEDIASVVAMLYDCGSVGLIACSYNMNLIDGYTSYLVAKMFGHDTIRGYCYAKE